MKHLLSSHDWSHPVPIAYGPGRLTEIAEHCVALGISKPLIVTDKGSAALPFIKRTQLLLEDQGIASSVFSQISPNPRDHEVKSAKAMFRGGSHDGVIAMGGGSGMDGGKATCLTANNEVDLWNFNYDRPVPDVGTQTAFPPLICIPTTSGTGAETESTAMITDTQQGMKLCVWHPTLKPSLALLDPELTLALPAHLTAWTGIDALIHAIEAYCVPGFHPQCDGTALEAIKLITRWLPIAVADPGNLEARGGMQVGSCLGGIAFLKGLGLVHAISHMVGADYDTHHGLTNAVVLPAVMRFNAPALEEKLAPMAAALELKSDGFESFYQALCTLLDALEIPRSLADLDVPLSAVPVLAKKAHLDAAASTNARPASVSDIEAVLEEAITHGR
ncbi:MAG: iron-containing alcohol dehydrogenase [Luminiphilus sp.]|nr:iron-containing alcohol dehydrogenase [Luminiphilus sp.]MDG1461748.1 iron-containing alcohol dehydrogenase [Luminiphilus sp.]